MRFHRFKAVAAVTMMCTVGALTLTGCGIIPGFGPTQEPAGSRVSSKSEKPKPVEEAEPAEEAEPVGKEAAPAPVELVLPTACDAMNSTAFDEAAAAIANLNLSVPIQAAGPEIFENTAGAVAKDTLAKSIRVESCYYPVHFHNAVTQYVAEVPTADQATLIAALRDDPTITEKSSGRVLHFAFDQLKEGPNGSTMSTQVNYMFAGDVWIAVFDNGELDYAPAAIDGLLAANPTL
ncbi:hypothetical protein [Leucobacter salsicius]|uniref:hypothetical protein n=1 Tax=Leucobacter salsicius TaxID=664638 RepID=UPI000347CF40|nr:hypothetical protein [Leucobacter salsicius]